MKEIGFLEIKKHHKVGKGFILIKRKPEGKSKIHAAKCDHIGLCYARSGNTSNSAFYFATDVRQLKRTTSRKQYDKCKVCI